MFSAITVPKFMGSLPWVDLRTKPDPENRYSVARDVLQIPTEGTPTQQLPKKHAVIYADNWGELHVTVKNGEPWARWERTHPHVVCSVPLVCLPDKKLSVILIEQSRPNSNDISIIDFPGGLVGDKEKIDNPARLKNKPPRSELLASAMYEFLKETGINPDTIKGNQIYSNVFPTIGSTNEQTHYVMLYIDYNALQNHHKTFCRKKEMEGAGLDNEGEVIKTVYLVPLSEFPSWFNEKQKEGKHFGASIFAAIGQLMLMKNPHSEYSVLESLPSSAKSQLSLMA